MNTIRNPVSPLFRATAGRAWSGPLATGLLLASVLAFTSPAAANDRCESGSGTRVSLDIHYGSQPFDDDPWLTDFVGYYGYSPAIVSDYCRAGFPENDLAVAVYLADRSQVSLDLIVHWRQRGLAWADVARRCRVAPAVFITPIPRYADACGIYSRPYACYSRYPSNGWRVSDVEARELVYLRFASDRYDCDPGWVMHERSHGRGWQQMATAWRDEGPRWRDRNADRGGRYADRDDNRDRGWQNDDRRSNDRESNDHGSNDHGNHGRGHGSGRGSRRG